MDILLKQRLVGAIVLISLAVIFLPMLFTGQGEQEKKFESSIPAEPVYEIKSPQVSVPLPLPPKGMEKVPLREPVIPEEPTQAALDAQAAAVKAEPGKPELAKPEPKPEAKPEPQKISPPKPTVGATKPATAPASSPAVSAKPSKPTAAAAEIKPSNVSGWIVQVGSFSQKANAEKLRDKLRKMGMASFVATGTSGNKKVYRVRVGPEISRSDAEKIQATIKAKTKLNGLVMQYP